MSTPRVCLLSMSRIEDDPRVRRQGDALVHDRWSVLGVGLSGGRSTAPDWPVRRIGSEPIPAGGKARVAVTAQMLSARLSSRTAQRALWANPAVLEMWRHVRDQPADLFVANDWWTLPIAARAAATHGGQYAYDVHEHSLTQGAMRWRWRALFPPLIAAIEARWVPGSAAVSAVCEGIANELAANYDLAHPPVVVRSVPAFSDTQFRAPGKVVRVLYHGLLLEHRGLESLIDSVANWPDDFVLAIRGPGVQGYVDGLRRRIRRLELDERVTLLPGVPMTDLVAHAREHDIGIFVPEGDTPQRRHVLPNKLFEYVMAGLAVCLRDLPEMARLVREYNLGVLVPSASPRDLAFALRSLERDTIADCKRAAALAAKKLCWEVERETMLQEYRRCLGQ